MYDSITEIIISRIDQTISLILPYQRLSLYVRLVMVIALEIPGRNEKPTNMKCMTLAT
jgi:hypothetical protein